MAINNSCPEQPSFIPLTDTARCPNTQIGFPSDHSGDTMATASKQISSRAPPRDGCHHEAVSFEEERKGSGVDKTSGKPLRERESDED